MFYVYVYLCECACVCVCVLCVCVCVCVSVALRAAFFSSTQVESVQIGIPAQCRHIRHFRFTQVEGVQIVKYFNFNSANEEIIWTRALSGAELLTVY
jgi:hypothetical protein